MLNAGSWLALCRSIGLMHCNLCCNEFVRCMLNYLLSIVALLTRSIFCFSFSASGYRRQPDGACFQMRLSYSPAAHLVLFFVQWTDCYLAGALGLLRILIYMVCIFSFSEFLAVFVSIFFFVGLIISIWPFIHFKAFRSPSMVGNGYVTISLICRLMLMEGLLCLSMKRKQASDNFMVSFKLLLWQFPDPLNSICTMPYVFLLPNALIGFKAQLHLGSNGYSCFVQVWYFLLCCNCKRELQNEMIRNKRKYVPWSIEKKMSMTSTN